LINVVVKSDLYERERSLVGTQPFVIVRGELQRREGTVNVLADSCTPLAAAQPVVPTAHKLG